MLNIFDYWYIILGNLLISCISAVFGVFAFFNKRSLLSDSISHSVLPGICFSFLILDDKNPLGILIGGFISSYFSILLVDKLTSKNKIKPNTAIAISLSFFFGLGTVLLSLLQKQNNYNIAGIDNYFFGNAVSVTTDDTIIFFIAAIIGLIILFFFKRGFISLIFDKDFTSIIGFPTTSLQLLLSGLFIVYIILGVQLVGVVLMGALLIIPTIISNFWSNKFNTIMILAFVFGFISSLLGIILSNTELKLPTGPLIVSCLFIFAIFSLFLAPKKGLISKYVMRKNNRNKIVTENILKYLYKYQLSNNLIDHIYNQKEISKITNIKYKNLHYFLLKLVKSGDLIKLNNSWQFSFQGINNAKRIIRLHRLWEVYLKNKLLLSSDHLHEEAETIEHVITPEIEQAMLKLLDFPDKDPHLSPITYL